jgi:hypothetical protein
MPLVAGKTPHLLADRRADSPARRGLAQRRAHRLRIGHPLGADYSERCGGGIIEPNVK